MAPNRKAPREVCNLCNDNERVHTRVDELSSTWQKMNVLGGCTLDSQECMQCGLHAINNLLCRNGRVQQSNMKSAARAVHQRFKQLDLSIDNNWHIDVLIHMLKSLNFKVHLYYMNTEIPDNVIEDPQTIGFIALQERHYTALKKYSIGWVHIDSLGPRARLVRPGRFLNRKNVSSIAVINVPIEI